jgi:signal peptidase I
MGSLLKFIAFLAILIAVAAVIGRIFFFNIGQTANYSMVPALIPGDIFLFKTRGLLGLGDIAVCKNPKDPKSLIVSRIIGLPGDNISIKNNLINYNGRVIQHSYVEPIRYEDNQTEETMNYVVYQAEEKMGGQLYTISFMDTSRGKNFKKIVVPQNSFFVLGDNRNMAHDSRNFGFVPIENCIGSVFFRLWAAPNNGDLKQSKRSFSWIR